MMQRTKRLNTSSRRGAAAAASDDQPLRRLCGLEVEYAFQYPAGDRCDLLELYAAIIQHVDASVPTVWPENQPTKCFMANGGAISWEANTQTLDSLTGYIESATPQCRSPRDVIAYQSVFDHLIAQTLTSSADPQLPLKAIRNNADAFGHTFGQQENYEVTIARGWWLAIWRLLLILFFPALLIHRLCSTLILAVCLGRSGGQDVRGAEYSNSLSIPKRRLQMATAALQVCHWPLETLFRGLCRLCIMRRHRRCLLPFLASRVILDGAGHIDRRGRYWVSSRGRRINAAIDLGGSHRRPIVDLSHWFREICLDPSWRAKRLWRLWGRRQRVQICCGDTSPNQWARWLQIGSTCLMLDAIESDEPLRCPRFARPDTMIRRFASDQFLKLEVADTAGRRWSALQLQRHYLTLAQSYLKRRRVPDEARRLVDYWQTTLDRLAEPSLRSNELVGRCDWITKQILLRKMPAASDLASRQKLDIRYHELHSSGYFQQIFAQQELLPLVDRHQLSRSLRFPPADTPAARRGYLIREFARGDTRFWIDWDETRIESRS